MRKKVYYQNAYGEKGDKDFIFNGTKTTFGIFSKDFSERVFQNSKKVNDQIQFVSSFFIICFLVSFSKK